MTEAESLFGEEHVRRYRETNGEVGHIWHGSKVLLFTTKGRDGRVNQLRILRDRVVAGVRHQQHFSIERFGDKALLGGRVRPVLVLLAHDDEYRSLYLVEAGHNWRVAGAGGLDARVK